EEKWNRDDVKGQVKHIFIKTSSRGGTVIIEIRDTGTGIPKQILDKIFEPFFTSKKVSQGTGLGLSISYGIVQDYDGTIRVETEEGVGASFIIQFPIAEDV
ncbi:sensor histidine kinase, partial [Thermodesulfobacteriota bacterium]